MSLVPHEGLGTPVGFHVERWHVDHRDRRNHSNVFQFDLRSNSADRAMVSRLKRRRLSVWLDLRQLALSYAAAATRSSCGASSGFRGHTATSSVRTDRKLPARAIQLSRFAVSTG